MYTKKVLRDHSNKSQGNVDQFFSSDFNQSDLNSFIDQEVSREKEKKKTENWFKNDEESSETSSSVVGTGKNFMKPKKKIQDKEEIPEIVVQNDIDSVSFSNADLQLDLNKSSDQSTLYNETIKENESNIDAGYQHPMTFEGFTENGIHNESKSPPSGLNARTGEKRQAYGVDTLKSNVSILPVDESNENFAASTDFTKKEHLLSKVSLFDSYEDGKTNKSSIRYDDFMSSTAVSGNHPDNLIDGTGYSYKTSINPASGDSYNTQGITNITDMVMGDTTTADLAALQRQYERATKESYEPTPNSDIHMSETVKEVPYDKSYPFEDFSGNNLESTRSFGMKRMNLDDMEEREKPAPTASPRKKNQLSKSNDNDSSHIDHHRTEVSRSRLSDNCEKKTSRRYSYVQSSGYGSKNTTPPIKDNGRNSEIIPERVRTNIKRGQKSSTKNFGKRNLHDESHRARSSNRGRSKSSNMDAVSGEILSNKTYKIRKYSNEGSESDEDNADVERGFDRHKQLSDPPGKEWHEKWLQERILVKKLQSTSMAQERDFKRQIENVTQQYERKISQLESQLVRARDQLSLTPDFNNKVLGPNVTTEDIERIKKDVKAQESIIAAYEHDNAVLRDEMKILKLKQKSNDHVDSFENGRLISQIASLRADLDSKEIEVRNLRQMTRENRITGNIVDNEFFSEELTRLKSEVQLWNKKYLSSESEKQKVQMQLDKFVCETEKMTNHYYHEIGVEKMEKEKLKDAHKVEVDDLKRKIKWYLENQAILDRESRKIKCKDEEIVDLKRQLDSSGTVKISSNIRAKERTADIARIKQLEEENMSLKEDLYSLVKGKNIGNVATKRTVQFLEEKIKSLEDDLERKVGKENTTLRSLQQQFESMKHQYEESIRDLELDLARVPDKRTESERFSRVTDLKGKIEQLTSDIQKKNSVINRLKVEIKSHLKDGQENKAKFDKNVRKIDPESRSDTLKKELREKDIEIQRLQIQNDYLKGLERGSLNTNELASRQSGHLEMEAENSRLKSQVAHLSFELDKHKQTIEEIKQVSLNNEHLLREECRIEVNKCEEYHKEQLKNVKIDFVGRHSGSENATLQSQVEVQKNYIEHLQSQISDYSVKARNNDAKIDELIEAKQQIQSLKSELSDLRLIWSNKPGLEMIDRLRSKVIQLEEKESLKGRQLDEYVQKVVKNNTKPFQEEVERWRTIVTQKNKNLLQVQNELNHLLESLEELRRQGISIPKFSNKSRLLSENIRHL